MEANMEHVAGRVSVMAPALRASGGPTRAGRRRRLWLTTADQPRWLASSLLLLSPQAASVLRAYAILNYTIGLTCWRCGWTTANNPAAPDRVE
ncbi:hypothetical protein SFRURICE_003505 [Spodoptera frugiperda]|uniref:SFRICE_040220 n=1 Tax=Spodoptera frugiperda TaxID=7108 RepID=A0A2H1VNY6_SPOFR|nr:hypothetical protein SFRURICE_011854 [Spodoptera frugiperda]KAF9809408.1 hypothetical protein SFRURICE_003505 [Spodoptera frugiperda]